MYYSILSCSECELIVWWGEEVQLMIKQWKHDEIRYFCWFTVKKVTSHHRSTLTMCDSVNHLSLSLFLIFTLLHFVLIGTIMSISVKWNNSLKISSAPQLVTTSCLRHQQCTSDWHKHILPLFVNLNIVIDVVQTQIRQTVLSLLRHVEWACLHQRWSYCAGAVSLRLTTRLFRCCPVRPVENKCPVCTKSPELKTRDHRDPRNSLSSSCDGNMCLLGRSKDDVWQTEASDMISDRKTSRLLENNHFKAPHSRAKLAPVSLYDNQCRKYYSFSSSLSSLTMTGCIKCNSSSLTCLKTDICSACC